jgi:hypothetical protein
MHENCVRLFQIHSVCSSNTDLLLINMATHVQLKSTTSPARLLLCLTMYCTICFVYSLKTSPFAAFMGGEARKAGLRIRTISKIQHDILRHLGMTLDNQPDVKATSPPDKTYSTTRHVYKEHHNYLVTFSEPTGMYILQLQCQSHCIYSS